MSADLSTNPSEVAENNSLREVLLFCLVLIVEVYSLAVSFGGPFFEVGYFLLVVISQTTAGAYIWAQLRQSDKTLPLPELLAMGFAIGSASAAISQLILRDLLGIRIFLSPLVPIIGVAIWLVAKRNTRLPVTITHATTNTLLWLLFPAPLALMTYSLFLLPLFITPLLLAIYFAKRRRILQIIPTIKSFVSILLFFVFTTVIHRISSALTKSETGIDPYADDIRFDVVQSISSSRWGLATNAELANQNWAYYKISFLWLAPITNFDSRSLLNLSVTLIPVFLITVAGASLWAITRSLSKQNIVAGIATILLFTQTNFSGDSGMSLRSVWLLGTIYLLSAGVFFIKTNNRNSIKNLAIIFLIGFVIAGTRITFIPFMLVLTIMPSGMNISINKKFLIMRIQQLTVVVFGVLMAILLFTRGENSTVFNSVFLTSADWPIDLTATLNFVANTATGRVAFFLGILLISKPYKKYRMFLILATLIYCFTQFVVPRAFVMDSVFFFPYLLVLTPVLAHLLSSSFLINKIYAINNFRLGVIAGVSGMAFKICYDLFQTEFEYDNYFKRLLSMVFRNQILTTLGLFVCCGVISAYFTRLLTEGRLKTFISCLVIAGLTSNVGILIGNQIRPITEHFRYDEILWGGERDTLLARWDDQALLKGLAQANTLIPEDAIFASNFGLSRGGGFRDGIRIQIEFPRRIYMSGNFNYYLHAFPLALKQLHSPQPPLQRTTSHWVAMISERFNTSMDFPNYPSRDLLANMRKENVNWFVVDLTYTTLRSWEPWATTRFINKKLAILELNHPTYRKL